jgi:dienelactone hydrolase
MTTEHNPKGSALPASLQPDGLTSRCGGALFRVMTTRLACLLTLAGVLASAGDSSPIEQFLRREIIGTNLALAEVQAFTESRVPLVPEAKSATEWEKVADRLRRETLARVVFRGEAVQWRKAKTRVVWLETIEGGPGYRIRKLRYEAVPGMWIPALLYEPEELPGPAPVVLNVNGHEGVGKSIPYKQIRCINQAKRGMLALNPEWLGMGQLRGTNYQHTRMNQLDLCGTSGLAPFYLAMARGLDVLLAHPQADPERVAVAGLSGGGWQTIFISALDTRVKLANPVAGYSSFRTRARHFMDLGDSEQTPCDLATVADYTHLTALMAPRPTLLTYNATDNCCFASEHALPPLLSAATPVFKLYAKERNLRAHVNFIPGDHNFGQDNREALYRMLGEHFYPGQEFVPVEIACESEVKTSSVLNVALPADNADFNSLARALSKALPRDPKLPARKPALEKWQREKRSTLRQIVRAKHSQVVAERVGAEQSGETSAVFWRLKVDDAWTVPAVELFRGQPKGTTLLIADGGRQSVSKEAEALLETGQRVIAVDPFYFGESRIRTHEYLFALLVAAVGERPLGVQAGQVSAVARWTRAWHKGGPVAVRALGPRTSLIALVAAALDEDAIAELRLQGALGSLKEIIEQDWTVQQRPELFCFGLLEQFDIKQLVGLIAPRPMQFREASERVKQELQGLDRCYATLGGRFTDWE